MAMSDSLKTIARASWRIVLRARSGNTPSTARTRLSAFLLLHDSVCAESLGRKAFYDTVRQQKGGKTDHSRKFLRGYKNN